MPRRIAGKAPGGFGSRLAALRKQAGLSQTALAQEIGISQRMMAYYEGPSAFPPATLLPAIARVLGVSVEALLGTETAKRKTKAVDTRMQRRLQQIASLPTEERRQIMQLVDAFIERGKLKQRQRPGVPMTTVQIQLPDDLAQDAQAAGLLTPEALERLLREQLRKQAGERLREAWQRLPDELTPEIEQMIDEEVRAARAERRKRNAS
jgi:transcriptional regulator with XRE-family HTH domain